MRRRLPGVLAALGFALLVAGVVVFAVADRTGTTADFGWSAYMPLSPDAYRSRLTVGFDDGWALLWSGSQVLGAVLVVVGLLTLTAVGSWSAGRRSGAQG